MEKVTTMNHGEKLKVNTCCILILAATITVILFMSVSNVTDALGWLQQPKPCFKTFQDI